MQALRQLLPISDLTGSSEEKHEEARGSYGEFGCINHSGVLTKTQVPFDLYVKVKSEAGVYQVYTFQAERARCTGGAFAFPRVCRGEDVGRVGWMTG